MYFWWMYIWIYWEITTLTKLQCYLPKEIFHFFPDNGLACKLFDCNSSSDFITLRQIRKSVVWFANAWTDECIHTCVYTRAHFCMNGYVFSYFTFRRLVIWGSESNLSLLNQWLYRSHPLQNSMYTLIHTERTTHTHTERTTHTQKPSLTYTSFGKHNNIKTLSALHKEISSKIYVYNILHYTCQSVCTYYKAILETPVWYL